jgi:hypothetical protein
MNLVKLLSIHIAIFKVLFKFFKEKIKFTFHSYSERKDNSGLLVGKLKQGIDEIVECLFDVNKFSPKNKIKSFFIGHFFFNISEVIFIAPLQNIYAVSFFP